MTATSVKATRNAPRLAPKAVPPAAASLDLATFEQLDAHLRRLVGSLDVLYCLYANPIDAEPDPVNVCELIGMMRQEADASRTDLAAWLERARAVA